MKINVKNRFISLFVCIIMMLVLVPLSSAKVDARSLSSINNDIDELASQISKLQKELGSIESDIADINYEKKLTQNDKALLGTELANLELQIELATLSVEKIREKISDLGGQIDMRTEDLVYYTEQLNSLIRYNFEQGEVSFWSILFTADSFSDFLTRTDNNKMVAQQIEKLKSDMEQTKNDLLTLQATTQESKLVLEAERASLLSTQESYETKYAALESALGGQESAVTELISQQYSSNAELAALQKKMTALKAEKKAEEERLEEERKAALAAIQGGSPAISADDLKLMFPFTVSTYVSSAYGNRSNPFGTGGSEFHYGTDFPAPYGTPIYAAQSGTVVLSTYYSGYGNSIIIDHGNGIRTLYAHASELCVSEGTVVAQGTMVAKVGSTGRSTGNHLHFGLMVDGSYIDPYPFLPKDYIKQR